MTTLARVVRIPVVLVLPSSLLLLLLLQALLLLLLVADGSWAHVYPREIKPGERCARRTRVFNSLETAHAGDRVASRHAIVVVVIAVVLFAIELI